MKFPRLALALICTAFLVTFFSASASKAQEESGLDTWLEAQLEIEAWAADVVQVRRLRGLTRPLESEGKVWFLRPDRFRWQLGEPPRTLAVRDAEGLVIAYPQLERAERYGLSDEIDTSWQHALALLDVGFPSDPESFRARYELLGAEELEVGMRYELRPASEEARRLIDKVWLEIAEDGQRLLATELGFPDGSTMRNEFENHDFEPEIGDGLFEIEIGESWEVVDPLENRG